MSRTSPKVWKCQIYPNMPSCKFPTNFYKHVNNPGNIANMTENHRLFAAVVRLVSVNVWNCMGRHVNVEWGLLKKPNKIYQNDQIGSETAAKSKKARLRRDE